MEDQIAEQLLTTLLRSHIKPIIDQCKIEIGKWRVECASKGLANSTLVDSKSLELARHAAKDASFATLTCCDQLRREKRLANDRNETIEAFLGTIRVDLINHIGRNRSSTGWLSDDRLATIGTEIEEMFSLYKSGLLQFLGNAEVTRVSNSIHVSDSNGVAIQQASPAAQLQLQLDLPALSKCVDTLNSLLIQSAASAPQLRELRADIDTIATQLSKQNPSTPIIQEAAKSLRNIAEGVAAGVLSSPAQQGLRELFRIVGLA